MPTLTAMAVTFAPKLVPSMVICVPPVMPHDNALGNLQWAGNEQRRYRWVTTTTSKRERPDETRKQPTQTTPPARCEQGEKECLHIARAALDARDSRWIIRELSAQVGRGL